MLKQNQTQEQNQINVEMISDLIRECRNDLLLAGFDEVNKNIYNIQFINNRKILGRCTYIRLNTYSISVNINFYKYANRNNIRNTIMHEMIHSLKNCMCHTKRWKSIVKHINAKYPNKYNINRLTNINQLDQRYQDYVENTKKPNKYIVECKSCHKTWGYQRTTKVIKGINLGEKCICPICKGLQEFTVIKNY